MSILDVFETGQHKQEKGHLRNLIMIAKADGDFSEDQHVLIQKMAMRYNIAAKDVKALIDHPEAFAINPPAAKEDRYKEMLELVKMAYVDKIFEVHEMELLQKFAIGIGFPTEQSIEVVKAVCKAVSDGITDLDEITLTLDQILDL